MDKPSIQLAKEIQADDSNLGFTESYFETIFRKMNKRIKWEEVDGYRNLHAYMDDYLLVIKGGNKHEFNWFVFKGGDEVLTSISDGQRPTRSVPEAMRISEAVYLIHARL